MSYYSKNIDKRLECGKIYYNKEKKKPRSDKGISRKRRTLFYSEKIKRNKILDNENENDKFKNLCNDEFKDNDDVLEIKKLLTIYFD
jgi:hypothetical protein